MNDYQRLLRDARRCPFLVVTKRGPHWRIRRADGTGPTVSLSSSHAGPGRGLANACSLLKRKGLLPPGWS